jgi:glycosyltransferase involved in cell wall biosynthesis
MALNNKIRVFHLIKGLGRGGAETLLSEGLRFADRERFEYGYGYFLPWKDALVDDLKAQGAEVHNFRSRNPGEMFIHIPRVSRHLHKWGADLLHCHLPTAGIVGRLAGKIARVPVIYTEHNLLERYHWLTRSGNRRTWRMQNQVIAVSNEVLASVEYNALNSVPVRVIQNGVDINSFSRHLSAGVPVREQWSIPLDAPVVGTVAVFTAKKKLDEWLRVASEVHEKNPEVHFLIVGDGPLRSELDTLKLDLGLRQVVHFVGLQEDVRSFLTAMDVYLMSSQYEGLPIALLEAMAMELPVVATAVGGVPEVVKEGKTGFLVPAGRPGELAAAAKKLLEDPDMGQAMGRAGRTMVKEKFSMERMVRQTEEVYLEVLEKTKGFKEFK